MSHWRWSIGGLQNSECVYDESLMKLQSLQPFQFHILLLLLKILLLLSGEEKQWNSVLMNYASLLQMIIPGSPWKQKITTATPITSMPAQSWVLFIHYGSISWLIAYLLSLKPFFFLYQNTCWGWISLDVSKDLSLIQVQNFVLHAGILSGFGVNHIITFCAFKMAAPWRYTLFHLH